MVKSGYAESLEVGGGGSAACIDAGMRISGVGRSDHDTPHVANGNFCGINNEGRPISGLRPSGLAISSVFHSALV